MDDTSAPQTDDTAGADASAARLFDIRRIIGGLFVLYGVAVTAAGLFDGDAARKQAAGIDINLWTGLGMLALGVVFLVWMRLNPLTPPPPPEQADGTHDRPGGPEQH
ncbi:MAG: hypothetical protein QOE19_3620 [Actinomycetota bacterium]|jgi:hypothetical protein|nr:hypothetical protein [Actinomycetota bacterium]MDQ1667459.1 hypothetical protein [Actinomycetota bacterium]MDQ1668656.1 hypothetical protein [Actinomycetota bacterium]